MDLSNFFIFFILSGVKRETDSSRARYRNPRIPFSTSEVGALEKKFLQSPYLGSHDVNELASALNMSPKRVNLIYSLLILCWKEKENPIVSVERSPYKKVRLLYQNFKEKKPYKLGGVFFSLSLVCLEPHKGHCCQRCNESMQKECLCRERSALLSVI